MPGLEEAVTAAAAGNSAGAYAVRVVTVRMMRVALAEQPNARYGYSSARLGNELMDKGDVAAEGHTAAVPLHDRGREEVLCLLPSADCMDVAAAPADPSHCACDQQYSFVVYN